MFLCCFFGRSFLRQVQLERRSSGARATEGAGGLDDHTSSSRPGTGVPATPPPRAREWDSQGRTCQLLRVFPPPDSSAIQLFLARPWTAKVSCLAGISKNH